jgi:hypothetical protein
MTMLRVVTAVEAFMVPDAVTVVPVSVMAPIRRSAPATVGPKPMVVAPPPGSTHPDVTRHRANCCDLHNGSRHWGRHNDRRRSDENRRRSHNNGRWSRDSNIDADMNPGMCGGDSNGGQGQKCDNLFHNFYPFDGPAWPNTVTIRLPSCKPIKEGASSCVGT